MLCIRREVFSSINLSDHHINSAFKTKIIRVVNLHRRAKLKRGIAWQGAFYWTRTGAHRSWRSDFGMKRCLQCNNSQKLACSKCEAYLMTIFGKYFCFF
jgi:hypothetical protein